MSLIKPHLHIHTTTHIPQQPSKPKHHITHLILQFFPTSSLTHLHDFIPNLLQSQSKFTFIIPQASTIFHLSNFLLTLIRFKYFFETNSIFLVCIDFWNHILTKKMFFCFFLFCSGHPSCHGHLVISGHLWSSLVISSVVVNGHLIRRRHGHLIRRRHGHLIRRRHPHSQSWSSHPCQSGVQSGGPVVQSGGPVGGHSGPVLHLTSASRRCIAFNVSI